MRSGFHRAVAGKESGLQTTSVIVSFSKAKEHKKWFPLAEWVCRREKQEENKKTPVFLKKHTAALILFHKTSQPTYGLMTVVSNIQKKKNQKLGNLQ